MRACWIALLITLAGAVCRAQDESVRKFEVGAQFAVLDLRNALGEKPGGIGGRFGYNLNQHVAFEGEVNYFPQNPSGNFGETEALLGIKLTQRFGNTGVFAKVRPGFVHFGGDFYETYNGKKPTFPAADIGGGVEHYLGDGEHFGVRLEFGDTIISFRDGQIFSSNIQPYSGGIKNNLQMNVGVFYRF